MDLFLCLFLSLFLLKLTIMNHLEFIVIHRISLDLSANITFRYLKLRLPLSAVCPSLSVLFVVFLKRKHRG
jgi:hypothetical protein